MKKFEEKLSKDAELLNKYLYQYKNCIKMKRNLEHRRNEILTEFNNPLSSVRNDGMPHGTSSGVGCAALAFRLDEIECCISEQIEKTVKVLTNIMNVIDFLPENSIERNIFEHKYIDRFNWGKICEIENMSRTSVINYWRKGLYKLLEFKKVQTIIRDYEKTLNLLGVAGFSAGSST